jgi:alpha-L-rhamnosidase
VAFLGTTANNHIIEDGLGDHMEPDRKTGKSNYKPIRTPSNITSTGMYYYDVHLLAEMAKTLGKSDDYKRYATLADEIKDAFNKKFLNTKTNEYASGSQTSNAMALHFGLVPDELTAAVLKNLVDDIMVDNEGHLSTGIMGTNALEQVLGELGRADVMYALATKTTYPSWGYSISKGATTLWESFEVNNNSQNMKMFGSTEKFFYKDLAGISPLEPGYKRIRIKSQIVGDLAYAKASVETVRGTVKSHWKKRADNFTLNVTIPVNSTAIVYVPATNIKDVTESGKIISEAEGVTFKKMENGKALFEVESGSYTFVSEMK